MPTYTISICPPWSQAEEDLLRVELRTEERGRDWIAWREHWNRNPHDYEVGPTEGEALLALLRRIDHPLELVKPTEEESK